MLRMKESSSCRGEEEGLCRDTKQLTSGSSEKDEYGGERERERVTSHEADPA